MKKFEINKTYKVASVCDHNCIWEFTVIKRTAQTITIVDDMGIERRCRINKRYSEWDDAECVLPLGNYSMAPILRAN